MDVFARFGEEGKILCADGTGHAVVHDTRSRSTQGMPTMNAAKGHMHVALSVPRTRAHAASAAACNDPDSDTGKESYIFQRVSGDHAETLYVIDMALNSQVPFRGRLSSCRPHHLCAVSSLDPPEGWSLTSLHLVNLGSGRLCTAKLCAAGDDDDTYRVGFVFTGVEVVRCGGDQDGELEMIKHKSRCVASISIERVL
ncbi:hypothetical protein BAE44_0009567 [Dichanthelium oligosanthes]|uniref:Uncharacterized protein n=1 Tax=Dichanthelium oligosanthes TaxID=888268 RepID=A0A1E5VWD1_9POAL|nr:hypothetical protein BAE44_0009567 [Dichanthelium oligosanthes]